MFYMEHALVYPSHRFKTSDVPENFTSTTFSNKCGVKASSGGQESYVMKTHLELSYLGLNFRVSMTVY